MLLSKRGWIILGSGLVLTGIAAVVVAKSGDVVTATARERILKLFDVAPDCSMIGIVRNEGEPPTEAEFRNLLAAADSYYIDPMVRAALKAGFDSVDAVTIFILEDLFPQCEGQFPPESILDFSKQVLWYATRSHVAERMEVMGA